MLKFLPASDLGNRLFPGKRIFERGSGGSTLRYAQKGARITAVEDDSVWMTAVQTALENTGVAQRVTMKYIPFDFDQAISSQTRLTVRH